MTKQRSDQWSPEEEVREFWPWRSRKGDFWRLIDKFYILIIMVITYIIHMLDENGEFYHMQIIPQYIKISICSMNENTTGVWVVVYRWEYCLLSFIIFSQLFCVGFKMNENQLKRLVGFGGGECAIALTKVDTCCKAKRRDHPYYWQIFCEWPSLKCPGLGARYQRSHNPIHAFREIQSHGGCRRWYEKKAKRIPSMSDSSNKVRQKFLLLLWPKW